MAPHDEQDQESDRPVAADGPPKPDLRYSAQERSNLRVERLLDGSGGLARGDRTRMSVLNFSSRHQARDEPAPEPGSPPPGEAPAPPPPAPPGPAAGDPATGADRPPTILGRVRKAFGFPD